MLSRLMIVVDACLWNPWESLIRSVYRFVHSLLFHRLAMNHVTISLRTDSLNCESPSVRSSHQFELPAPLEKLLMVQASPVSRMRQEQLSSATSVE